MTERPIPCQFFERFEVEGATGRLQQGCPAPAAFLVAPPEGVKHHDLYLCAEHAASACNVGCTARPLVLAPA